MLQATAFSPNRGTQDQVAGELCYVALRVNHIVSVLSALLSGCKAALDYGGFLGPFLP